MQKSLKNKQVKLVVLDLGGVFFDFHESIKYLSTISDVPLEVCNSIWQKHDDQICRGQVNPDIIWTDICKNSHKKLPDINFINTWVSHFKTFAEMHSLVVKISHKYEIAILTNIFTGAYTEMIKLKKIPELNYSYVIESSRIGLVKPELEIYQYLESMTGYRAAQILFIDDNQINIIPAQQLGWNTFLFDQKNNKIYLKIQNILKL